MCPANGGACHLAEQGACAPPRPGEPGRAQGARRSHETPSQHQLNLGQGQTRAPEGVAGRRGAPRCQGWASGAGSAASPGALIRAVGGGAAAASLRGLSGRACCAASTEAPAHCGGGFWGPRRTPGGQAGLPDPGLGSRSSTGRPLSSGGVQGKVGPDGEELCFDLLTFSDSLLSRGRRESQRVAGVTVTVPSLRAGVMGRTTCGRSRPCSAPAVSPERPARRRRRCREKRVSSLGRPSARSGPCVCPS